jgi:putative ATP-dependent endonuclease of OLD family
MESDERLTGYLGLDNIKKILRSLTIGFDETVLDDNFRCDIKQNGIFVGDYTFEVDIMQKSIVNVSSMQRIINTYNTLEESETKQRKFYDELIAGQFFNCLNRIEASGIGKGRFAQRFSDECIKENIPLYITEAIEYITRIVSDK